MTRSTSRSRARPIKVKVRTRSADYPEGALPPGEWRACPFVYARTHARTYYISEVGTEHMDQTMRFIAPHIIERAALRQSGQSSAGYFKAGAGAPPGIVYTIPGGLGTCIQGALGISW